MTKCTCYIEHGAGDVEEISCCPLHTAAPELLNALKVFTLNPTIKHWLETYDPKALEQARAAIAKAEREREAELHR